jgi:beta-mannosidase
VDLTGTWQAAVADEPLRRSFHTRGFNGDSWEHVKVPGHWENTPAFTDESSVLFRHAFEHSLPPEDGGRSWLELDGVFYQGDVWLDGDYLGDTEGYFIRHAFDVTAALRESGDHELALEVNCAPSGRSGKRRSLLGVFEGGNDMVPRGNPGGIWAPVRLRHTGPARIHGVRAICIEANPTRAVVAVRAILQTPAQRTVRVITEIAGVQHELEHSIAEGLNEVEWRVEIPEPDLWWPHRLGDQPLYELDVRVETRSGEVSDQHGQRIGLRSVAIQKWQVFVNGEKLFIKGVNVGPTRAGLAEVTPAAVDQQLQLAKNANLDMVRPYAHVAPDMFYDRADELGLLVWQDLPLLGPVSNSLRSQAVRQTGVMVDQLGHHPSIVTWNGHVSPAPEMKEGSKPTPVRFLGRLGAHQLPTWTKSVLDRSIKRVFESQDGSRHTSGFSGVLPHLPRLEGSASHLWFGWRRGLERDLPEFAARWPLQVRFVAEFGAQSLPDTTHFMDGARWPDIDTAELTELYGYEAGSFETYVPPHGHPSLESWREATQLYQAGLLRRQIEALRRLKYRPTGGFCIHHLCDAVPTVSASLVGSDGRQKLSYRSVADACQPVIVVADRLPARVVPGQPIAVDIHVVSDLAHPVENAVIDATISWAGDTHRWRFSGPIEADAVTRVGTLSWVVPDAPGLATLTVMLSGPIEAMNRYDTTIRS